MSSNVFKGSFIKFTGENTRVIDTSALVAKRMEGFTGVLREREEENASGPVVDSEGNLVSSDSIDALTDANDGSFEEALNGEGYEGEFTEGIPNGEEIPDSAIPDEELTPETVREDIEDMLKKANNQAAQIREEAQKEAEAIKEAAQEEGYNKGKEEALSELLAAKRELEDSFDSKMAEYYSMVEELEPKMVEAITGIYRHVFGSSLYSNKDTLVCLLNKALLGVDSEARITIGVSPLDYEAVLESKEELLKRTNFSIEPEILEKESLTQGEAKIDTPYGIIDCSIETELSELEKALIVLSYKGNSET